MTPERWRQIEKVYHSALELAENERPAFLEKTCAGDEALRQEVESLLRSEPSGDRFIEEPALEVAARIFAQENPQSLLGQQIGSYKVISLLGAGGMGEVYLAQDARLERRVAVKMLPAELASDPERMRRFVREAKAASALNHPNVATIHEIGEADGTSFIVMEYVEGQDAGCQDQQWPTYYGRDSGDRHPSGRCPRRSPYERHHPSRHQACQLHAHETGSDKGAGLRPGESHAA
jgi:hypothetical protein